MTDASGASVSRRVTILNGRGLHARAAAKFVKLAGTFDAEIVVARNDVEVAGSSIMGLMMLGAAPGCELELRASGRHAAAAVEALSGLIANRFDEEV
ncbi:MAG: HPr family phosphocarrier protein [Kiloniellales bacterium]|jgi:phosphocarrier protein HPr|nr:HPr family phosphocarrier protein [Kiloniellales bacterium]